MTTSPEITETETLLRELVSAFVDKPEAVRVLICRGLNCWGYELKVHPEDESKAIGQRGSHVNSLALLVQEIGAKAGYRYLLSLQTLNGPQTRRNEPPRASGDFDPEPAIAVLGRVLAKIVRHKFTISPLVGYSYEESATELVLRLAFTNPEDGYAIRRPIPLLTTATNGRDPLLLDVLGSLGTIARAIGRKSGVRLTLQLEPLPAQPHHPERAGNY